MKRTKYTAKQVVKWLQIQAKKHNINDLTQMKIQKLLYLCQAYSFSFNDSPLFSDKIVANEYGPTVTSIIKDVKPFGKNNVENIYNDIDINFDEETLIILNFVFNKFKKYTAGKLVDLTHQDSAWLDTSIGCEITQEKIKECYENKKITNKPSEDYIKTLGKLILTKNKVAFAELAK